MTLFFLAIGYLAVCFLASALVVRLAPRTLTAHAMVRSMAFSPAFPVFLVADVLELLFDIGRTGQKALRSALARGSARTRRRKVRHEYFSYGQDQTRVSGRDWRSARRRPRARAPRRRLRI